MRPCSDSGIAIAKLDNKTGENVLASGEMRQDARYVDVPTAAEHFACSDETVRRWIRAGHLPAVRFGKRGTFRIPLSVLNDDDPPGSGSLVRSSGVEAAGHGAG